MSRTALNTSDHATSPAGWPCLHVEADVGVQRGMDGELTASLVDEVIQTGLTPRV